MGQVGASVAIKQFFEKDSVRNKIEIRELGEFKKACSPEEFRSMAESAAKQLGVELTPA